MFKFFQKPFVNNSEKEFYKYLFSLIKFRPKNLSIYIEAFTHRSFHRFENDKSNNERLEFLGDSILDSIIAEHLYSKYPNKEEGFLTNMKSKIVNRNSLDEIAEKLDFNLHLKKVISENCSKKHFYGNALEALIGAIYVDRNYKYARKFVINQILIPFYDINILEKIDLNYKSQLLEWCQKQKKEYYFESSEFKSDLKTILFKSKVYVDNTEMGFGTGSTKKESEQNASLKALMQNNII